DAAGAQASVRGGELLAADGFQVDVVTLPDGLDPDELLLQGGPGRLETFLKNAVPFIDYYLAQAMQRHPGLSPESKLAVAKEVLPLLRRLKDPLLQEEHLARVAGALHAEKHILAQQMKKIRLEAVEAASSAPVLAPVALKAVLGVEEEMLLLALLYPSESVAAMLDAIVWQDPRCRQTWPALRTQVAQATLHLA